MLCLRVGAIHPLSPSINSDVKVHVDEGCSFPRIPIKWVHLTENIKKGITWRKNCLSRKEPFNELLTHLKLKRCGRTFSCYCSRQHLPIFYTSALDLCDCGETSCVHYLDVCFGLLKNLNMKLSCNFSNRSMKALWPSSWECPYCAIFSPLDDGYLHCLTCVINGCKMQQIICY